MIEFRMLGPLEMAISGSPVNLGGAKQRATLAYLLLRPNRVVPISELIAALWEEGDPPQTARKIIQNAVWNLRRALTSCGQDTKVAHLLTRDPGYIICVDQDQIDLMKFQSLVNEGRGYLADGDMITAEKLLGRALELWRGQVLADLVESGISWPQLTGIQNMRLDVLEDYFEAALANGRHQTVLSELESLAEAEPLRERLSGQLMLALYHCGRQADALQVYQRVRKTLIDELGLEPGQELRDIQQRILTHGSPLVGIEKKVIPAPSGKTGNGYRLVEPKETDEVAESYDQRRVVAKHLRNPGVSDREEVTVALIRCRANLKKGLLSDERADLLAESMADIIQESVECFGGTVIGNIGSVTLCLFRADCHGADHAERTVRSMLGIRDSLANEEDSATNASPVTIRAAVNTGKALVRYSKDGQGLKFTVFGRLIDECEKLINSSNEGEILVCDETYRSTNSVVFYGRGEASGQWSLWAEKWEYIGCHSTAIVDRDFELDVLEGMVARVSDRAAPHLVTLLGGPGLGKTRLLIELQRRLDQRVDPVQTWVARIPAADIASSTPVLVNWLLTDFCDIGPGDSGEAAEEKFRAQVEPIVGKAEAEVLLTTLSPESHQEETDPGYLKVLDSLALFLRLLAKRKPLVLLLDDLHKADDAFLDCIEGLAVDEDSLPLLVVAGARTDLLERRPDWAGGKSHTMTLTLSPLPDHAIDQLLTYLVAVSDDALSGPDSGVRRHVLSNLGENPNERRDYLRKFFKMHSPKPESEEARISINLGKILESPFAV